MQKRWISGAWGTSDNNRKAKFYSITKAGRKQLHAEAQNWERVSTVIGRASRNEDNPMFASIRALAARIRAWCSPRSVSEKREHAPRARSPLFGRAPGADKDFEHELVTHLEMALKDGIGEYMRKKHARR
jgi:hypothetical protein